MKLAPVTDRVNATEVYFNRDMRKPLQHVGIRWGLFLWLLQWDSDRDEARERGEVAWRNRSVGKRVLTYAGSRLYVLSEDGVVGLIEATSDSYKEKSRVRDSCKEQLPHLDTASDRQRKTVSPRTG